MSRLLVKTCGNHEEFDFGLGRDRVSVGPAVCAGDGFGQVCLENGDVRRTREKGSAGRFSLIFSGLFLPTYHLGPLRSSRGA